MFYAHFVLAKKGPLARIWLAAHWDKKLTKAHVFETNIEKSVDGILQPKVKMALRTSGHLLLGVVRIYSRKAKYLLADCNEAFVKIKMAFRPGMVDLPEEHREAAVNAITLPEVFHDFDTTMPELNDVDIEAQFSLNQSRAEEITMREDYGSMALVSTEDGFGDMGFDTEAPELMRHTTGLEPSMEQSGLLFTDGLEGGIGIDKDREPIPSTSGTQPSAPAPMEVDLDQTGGLFEGGLFDEAPMGEVPPVDSGLHEATPAPPEIPAPPDSDDDMDHFGGPPSVRSSLSSRPPSPLEPTSVAPPASQPTPAPEPEPQPESLEEPRPTTPLDQTTLLQNEEESFALAPVDTSALKDIYWLGFTKTKRKRKLIVDEVKNISGEEMKQQLSDTTDIVTTLDLAPPTKRLMHWKETGGVEKLFALPARQIPSRVLFKNYQRHLILRAIGTEDFAMLGDADSLALDQIRDAEEQLTPGEPVIAPRRGRKRKVQEDITKTPQRVEEPTPVPTPAPPILQPEEALAAMMPPTPVAPPSVAQPIPEELEPQPPPSVPPPAYPETPAPPPMGYPETPLIQAPPSVGYPITPAPPTPLHLEEMPHLPSEQVRSILQEQEQLGLMPPMTPATSEEVMAQMAQPPMGRTSEMPLGGLELPSIDPMPYSQEGMQMANMGYDAGAVSERVPSPWQGDYDLPPSAGPEEEQMENETDEQFEERVLNKRAYQMFTVVRNKLQFSDQLTLSEMCLRNNRKQAAQKFYSLLVLKKFHVLELHQEGAYEEVYVSKGSKFDNPIL
ncbi:double-strand-break repair protein rad21 homolog isoform X2 [Agrilus planipennis]|uniref:Double-strand-break repair protein rad21 homolog isoform X2 n=1 Tax=Agrilus planipennis TaxID=224129 RepID=A0A7F5R8T0_AGRPL|nr:double-strand-break repair protein rad21 homolog isoform X2 [Agrilus planipennis]